MKLDLTSRLCPVCNSNEFSKVFSESSVHFEGLDQFAFASRKLPEYMHWRLVECQSCDVLYADPAPLAEDLASLYRDADFDSREEARLASRTYAAFLPAISRRLPDKEGALDVGTGDGAFLRELISAGFSRIVGVEPSVAPVAVADSDVRSLIQTDVFRPDTFAEESLSLVTCFQTIEHLHEPLAFCRDALRLLKPGGALFLIGHNRRAFSAKILGERSPIFDIEHLQLFSPRGLESLLSISGYEGIEIKRVLNRYPIRYWMKLFPLSVSLKSPLMSWLSRSCVGKIVIPLPAGNLAAIAFKPRRKNVIVSIN